VSGVAYASNASVFLTFDEKLQSVGVNTVNINSQEVTMQSSTITGNTLTILLPNHLLKTGDTVEVAWHDLITQGGQKLNGSSPPIIAE
jgi:hypothetical protein